MPDVRKDIAFINEIFAEHKDPMLSLKIGPDPPPPQTKPAQPAEAAEAARPAPAPVPEKKVETPAERFDNPPSL